MCRAGQPFVTPLIPVPAVLVTCGTGYDASIITISWITVLSANPPRLGMSVRPARDSYRLLVEHPEMVVNVPGENLLLAMDICGSVSGRTVNKWKAAGLSRKPSSLVAPPSIRECDVHIECRRFGEPLPMGTHHFFTYDVLETRGRAKSDVDLPVLFYRGAYWSTGKRIEPVFFSARDEPPIKSDDQL